MIEQFSTDLLLPAWFFYLSIFCLGAIIGSFLNVFIYRFHTGKSLGGSSHCLSCAKQLRWYELFPLFSYVALRGRCLGCKSFVPVRYFVVEFLTAGMFVVAAHLAGSIEMFVWLTSMFIVLILITVYDYYHFIIPDEMTAALVVLMSAWLGFQYWLGALSLYSLGVLIAASVAGASFLFFLWFVSRGQWLGFGDVKLAIPLGLWVGATSVFSFIVVSFWIGAAISLLILAWQKYERGKRRLHLSAETLTMKSAVPFAPFMIAGAALVYITQFDVLSLFSFV
jgi:leader peptidase (prepilin peptidase)/N-methyltransferase